MGASEIWIKRRTPSTVESIHALSYYFESEKILNRLRKLKVGFGRPVVARRGSKLILVGTQFRLVTQWMAGDDEIEDGEMCASVLGTR